MYELLTPPAPGIGDYSASGGEEFVPETPLTSQDHLTVVRPDPRIDLAGVAIAGSELGNDDLTDLITPEGITIDVDHISGKSLSSIDAIKTAFEKTRRKYLPASIDGGYERPFGRDLNYATRDLMSGLNKNRVLDDSTRSMIENNIFTLVHFQGRKEAKLGNVWRPSAEEPGKMHHEAGDITDDTKDFALDKIDSDSTTPNKFVYFGSVDASPLSVVTFAEYIKILRGEEHGDEKAGNFLTKKVENFRGEMVSVAESMANAVAWQESTMDKSDLRLLEYQRRPGQEKGFPNQAFKDSLTAYVHKNGELANTNGPIASIEIQSYAHDAYLEAADVFEAFPDIAKSVGVDEAATERWRGKGRDLAGRIIDGYWIPEDQRFAQAIDRDPITGEPRRIAVPSSNELHLLNSRVIEQLPKGEQRQYVTSLVDQAFSDDFLTDAGYRERARSMNHLIDFKDYHGSDTVWPFETHYIDQGLLKLGYGQLALQGDTRALNYINLSEGNNEFGIVDSETQTVYYKYMTLEEAKERNMVQRGHTIVATNKPFRNMWSEAARIDIKHQISERAYELNDARPAWVAEQEQSIMSRIPHRKIIKTREEMDEIRQASPLAIIDIVAGKAADARYYEVASSKKQLVSASNTSNQGYL